MRYLKKILLISTAMIIGQQAYGICSPSPTFGDDNITCSGTVNVIDGFGGADMITLETGANVTVIVGDSFEGTNLIGFDDQITLNSGSKASTIKGDDFFDPLGGNQGGNDIITIDNAEVTTRIIGDALEGSNNIGGSDTIIVQNGSLVGIIKGDEFSAGSNNQGGNDIITVEDSTVNLILGEDGDAIGGDDTVNLRSATITESILLKQGSDIVNIYDLNNKIGDVIDGGDDVSSADGYIDQINLLSVQGAISTLGTVTNFEYFNIKEGSNIDFGDTYSTASHEQFVIDNTSTVLMSGGGLGIYTINANLTHDGLLDFTDNIAGDHLIITGNNDSSKGDLSGQGLYKFDTDFGSGISDYITVNGDVKAQSTIAIAPTGRGLYSGQITLIEANNDTDKSNEDFNLTAANQYNGDSKRGRFTGSPYVWQLQTSENNWVLNPQPVVPITPVVPTDPTDPAIPITPVVPVDPTNPNIPITPTVPVIPPSIVAEIPAYTSLPPIAREIGMNELNRLHSRLGELRNTSTMNDINFDESKANIWLKGAINALDFESDNSFDLSGTYGGFNFGIDKKFELNNVWTAYLGLFGGYKTGNFETSGAGKEYSAREGSDIHLTTLSAGGYATFYNEWGSYIDIVAQYMDLESDIDAAGLQVSVDGYNILGSIEVGHSFDFAKHWIFEPQAKLKLSHIVWSDFFDGVNEVSFDDHTYVTGTTGFRLQRSFNFSQGEIKPWIYLGILHEFAETSNMNYGGVDFTTHDYKTAAEAKFGLTASFYDNVNLYGDIGYAVSSDEYQAIEGNVGIRIRW